MMNTLMEISFFTGGMAMTNGWLVQTSAGTLAVDAPEGMAAWLRGRGVTVSTLLLTHQHFDHVQDAALIQGEHGARIFAFADYSRDLTLELLMEMATGMPVKVEPFRVDEILEGRTEIEAGGVKWRLEHIPGHSPDSVTFHCAEEKIIFAGDVLFAGSIGRADFPGGSMEELVQGIVEKLLPLPDATRVFPGHGPETSIGAERMDNPYLS
ncbi:MAG: MBL fold metallo-hydrolase [Verrucomicrobia bacterium]|nr:MBL fold metallo-hydrolase [Verrucomicrobiota bacterium]